MHSVSVFGLVTIVHRVSIFGLVTDTALVHKVSVFGLVTDTALVHRVSTFSLVTDTEQSISLEQTLRTVSIFGLSTDTARGVYLWFELRQCTRYFRFGHRRCTRCLSLV